MSISEGFVRNALKKTTSTGVALPEKRGKRIPFNKISEDVIKNIKANINSYPAYESHYSRERTAKKYLGSDLNISKMYNLYNEECEKKRLRPAKLWLYRKIFNEDFNLSFHLPDNDTCDLCDHFSRPSRKRKCCPKKK